MIMKERSGGVIDHYENCVGKASLGTGEGLSADLVEGNLGGAVKSRWG
jgi:hypothetical protein